VANRSLLRDQAIKPYDLRRFCEKTEEALEATVFTALTRFYRGLPIPSCRKASLILL